MKKLCSLWLAAMCLFFNLQAAKAAPQKNQYPFICGDAHAFYMNHLVKTPRGKFNILVLNLLAEDADGYAGFSTGPLDGEPFFHLILEVKSNLCKSLPRVFVKRDGFNDYFSSDCGQWVFLNSIFGKKPTPGYIFAAITAANFGLEKGVKVDEVFFVVSDTETTPVEVAFAYLNGGTPLKKQLSETNYCPIPGR